jgi:hypothetical protein
MNGTKDYINELIEAIDSQGFNYVIGIIKPKDNNEEKIDIFTNGSADGLQKLSSILREYQKSSKIKKEIKKE